MVPFSLDRTQGLAGGGAGGAAAGGGDGEDFWRAVNWLKGLSRTAPAWLLRVHIIREMHWDLGTYRATPKWFVEDVKRAMAAEAVAFKRKKR